MPLPSEDTTPPVTKIYLVTVKNPLYGHYVHAHEPSIPAKAIGRLAVMPLDVAKRSGASIEADRMAVRKEKHPIKNKKSDTRVHGALFIVSCIIFRT